MTSALHDQVRAARGIVFDLFHTLTSRESEWFNGPFTYQALGVSRAAWENQLFESSHFRLAGLERDHTAVIARMARAIDPDISDEIVARAVANRARRFAGALRNIPPENLALLQTLRSRSIKLGLVSNADCGEVESWSSSPLAPLFDSAVFSCHVGYVKPEPEIFLHCLVGLSLRPEECLFVGDGGSEELAAARSLGFGTVMVRGIMRELWPEKMEERARDADFVIEFPVDLLPG